MADDSSNIELLPPSPLPGFGNSEANARSAPVSPANPICYARV